MRGWRTPSFWFGDSRAGESLASESLAGESLPGKGFARGELAGERPASGTPGSGTESSAPWLALALSPLGALWGALAERRMNRPPRAWVPVPVLCVGNPVAGGGGKTPLALAFAEALAGRGIRAGLLGRGYGASLKGPVLIDCERHRAAEVGDEALLLAEAATAAIGADRARAAELLAREGCEFLILDDGLQDPSLAKDFRLLAISARRGIGNGFCIPAGPLRAPLGAQLRLADALIVTGSAQPPSPSPAPTSGERRISTRATQGVARGSPPIPSSGDFHASTLERFPAAIRIAEAESWRGVRAFAYAGTADPEAFFDSLRGAGASLAGIRAFADHHRFSAREADWLLAKAREAGAQLACTAKDMARLKGEGGALGRLREASRVLRMKAVLDEADIERILVLAVESARKRCAQSGFSLPDSLARISARSEASASK